MSSLGGPSIVTSGLVLHLDAGNTKSYPGTGTTWYDRSGNLNGGVVNNGTLVNGPSFSSTNMGSIGFDGVNDYVNTNYTPPVSNFTVSILYKCNAFSAWAGIWACEVWNSGTGYLTYFNTSTSLVFSKGGVTVASIVADSTKLANYTFTLASDGTAKIYINGILQSSTTIVLATSVTNPIILSTRYSNDGTSITDTRASIIPYFSVYNRVLSATEVLQNFNATRTRFGI